jgi:hypothetical protein
MSRNKLTKTSCSKEVFRCRIGWILVDESENLTATIMFKPSSCWFMIGIKH